MASTIGFGSIFGGLVYGLFEQATYEQSAKKDASNYAIHAADKRNDACFKTTDIEKPKCLKKERAEYELVADDNRRDYADLVAQRKSALWTFIMGVAALIGMGLSVIGVVLVYTTFSETRKANELSKCAQRAVIEPVFEFCSGDHVSPERVTISFRNIGGTTALNCILMSDLSDSHPSYPNRSGVSGRAHTVVVGRTIMSTIMAVDDQRGVGKFISGIITYNCTFGDDHMTYFCVKILTAEPNPLAPSRSGLVFEECKPADWPADT